ncbi:hypothetical protein [Bradyrhizobium sp.]|uniref:hypothetical protein n=1 Tax=Bradyrhizobium sp. TaxID=376 RepID=UPI002632E3B9|nr:hypothetical protein [Bradyrhizobium sp.]
MTDLFNPAPKEAAAPAQAPAPAKEACALRPGSSAAPGQHWFYHLDGHRRCWFQAADATHSVNKPVHHYAAKRPVIAPEENKVALPTKTVMDARDQLMSAAPPADASQPTAPAPTAVDAAPVPAGGAAMVMPAAPIAAQPTNDPLTPDEATPHHVDVEMLLADSSLDKNTAVSSVPPAAPGVPSVPQAEENHWELTATRAGVVLIALGLFFLLGSLLAGQFRDPGVSPIRRA